MIDSSNFTGPGAVFALLLANVRADYLYAPEDSAAFVTARQFLNGETCTHVLCDDCEHEGESGWERKLCADARGMTLPPTLCFECVHPLASHNVYEFDWAAHRDLIVGSLGIHSDVIRMILSERAS